MKKSLLSLLILMFMTPSAFAAGSSLQAPADLVIHPDQAAQFFTTEAAKISASPTWQWPSLQFDQPYHTTWTNVQAVGPFSLQFATDQLSSNQVAFNLTWQNPAIQVGQFEIHDTVQYNSGGINLVVHLDGACSNMTVQIPAGQWNVKGTLTWSVAAQQFVLKWSDFQFAMNSAAVPQINMGQCQGPTGLQLNLQQTFQSLVTNSSWLSNVLKQGFMDWAQSTMNQLGSQLLTPRQVALNSNIQLQWLPQGVIGLPGGLIQVPGVVELDRAGVSVPNVVLKKTYGDTTPAQATSSGFLLPSNTLPSLIQFLYQTGNLQYRVNSTQISSFQSLLSSWFLEFFVWPDLMNFPSSTQFWFDVGTESTPSLTNGAMAKGGGVSYDLSAPLVVHQWAPSGAQYLPYIDFRSPMKGQVTAQIKNGSLNLQLQPGQLNVTSQYRREFAATRSENTWIANDLLGSNVASYLQSQIYKIAIPDWSVGDGVAIGLTDLQVWHESFRIPVNFVSAPAK